MLHTSEVKFTLRLWKVADTADLCGGFIQQRAIGTIPIVFEFVFSPTGNAFVSIFVLNEATGETCPYQTRLNRTDLVAFNQRIVF